MNLIIVDGKREIEEEILSKIHIEDKFEVCSILEVEKENLKRYKRVLLVSMIEKHFLSFKTQEFLLDLKSEIFLFPVNNNSINVAEMSITTWVTSLNSYYGSNIIFHRTVDYNIFLEELNKYFDYITSDDYEVNTNSELVKLTETLLNRKFEPLNHFLKNENLETVEIYTDGACSGNPGVGGWGVVLIHGENKKEVSGFDPLTTNNKMELYAVIKGLSMLKRKCNVNLYSDSAYVVNAITQNWLENWKKNGWINSSKEQVKNKELWQELDTLLNYHNVNFIKVKGHADNFYNNRCDELATTEIAKNQTE